MLLPWKVTVVVSLGWLKLFTDNFPNLGQSAATCPCTYCIWTHAKISHLVQHEHVFLTSCWKEGWLTKIIPGPNKVSLQWRCLYAWMSRDHLALQLTHETVIPYDEVHYQTHQHSRSGSQHVACQFILCGLSFTFQLQHVPQLSPSNVFNLNSFSWWAVRLTKTFLYCRTEHLTTLTDNELIN